MRELEGRPELKKDSMLSKDVGEIFRQIVEECAKEQDEDD